MDVGHVQQRRLSDDIVSQLEAMILEGSLKAGERLPAERVLAERFGVSRPSLREALQKLVARRLLVSRQGGGNYVSAELGSTFSDPLLQLLESNPGAHRDLLEFRHTLEGSCAYYAAQRATLLDHQRLRDAYDALQACYAPDSQASRSDEGDADARFHLAIAEASHNAVLLHTIRGLFELLKHNVVTNIGGLYSKCSKTRDSLREQHQALFEAIVEGHAEQARECAEKHIDYVQEVLIKDDENAHRMARAQRRQAGMSKADQLR